MNRTLAVSAAMLVMISISACGTLPKLQMAELQGLDGSFVVDKTKPDSYPAVGLAEGNIYSCRAGIRFIKQERFDPPKAVTFGALLAKAKPELASHRVVLERFDVYQNQRLRTLSASGAAGGLILAAVASAADNKNNKAMDLENFSLKSNPGDGRWKPRENQVGCDGRKEGEYYASEVNRGHDVVVTWLEFTVDGTPYSFRSAYQYQFDDTSSRTADDKVFQAIDLTVTAVASEILL